MHYLYRDSGAETDKKTEAAKSKTISRISDTNCTERARVAFDFAQAETAGPGRKPARTTRGMPLFASPPAICIHMRPLSAYAPDTLCS
eukprot:1317040-Rhodomonas_salina.1